MVQIVCIKTGSSGICDIGDIVSIHNDDVRLDGNGYINSDIIKIEGKTATEFRNSLKYLEIKIDEIGVESWLNSDNKWCELKVKPKYSHSMKNITIADRKILSDIKIINKDDILSKIEEKIHLIEDNKIEIKEMVVIK